MKIIASITGKDISSTDKDDISYTSENKTWKILTSGKTTINVPSSEGPHLFNVSGLPDNGIGICYIEVPEHNAIYRLPRSNADTIMDYPGVDAYSGDNKIDIRVINGILTAKSISIIYFWMEKE